ncbi:MAG: phytanoyl-CoA dioxygenase family protein [Alphaproteobacteria bacterium]|nr:phytanoyl-CoA dioxygenase family protein [Alphaproteobacteria bacterium]
MNMDALRKQYREDGVVFLPRALDKRALDEALAAYEWSLANPGPGASRIKQHGDALFYQDLYNPRCTAAYRPMLEASPLNRIIADIWQTPDVWFMYEQVFLKKGGESRRTPWHQDSSYLAVAGDDLAVAWITFDRVAKEESLEFVRGSHRGTLYNGSSFALDDDTAPLHAGDALPRLPDIEAARSKYDIVAYGVEPGDVVLFHPAMLHGGAPTHPGQRRRTLTLRYLGRDSFYDRRPGPTGPRLTPGHGMQHGDRLRDPLFLKLL